MLMRGSFSALPRRCPECSFGDIDLNLNGDGRWKVEWHAVPCNVGDSKLVYSIVVSTYYWFSLVVSNTRCGPAPCAALVSGSACPLEPAGRDLVRPSRPAGTHVRQRQAHQRCV